MSSAGAFAQMLRALRERAGLTQEELAERAGLTPHAISSLERGVRTRPYPHTVRSLADALELDDASRRALIAAVPSRAGAGSAAAASPPGGGHARAPEAYAVPPSGADSLQPQALPVPLTTLVGRDQEVAAIADLLTGGDARLVTLTGLGGVGKTRLTLAAAETVREHFRDGVAWVPLAALAEPNLVVPTIGRAVGLAHVEGLDASDAVATGLRDRHLLLVLDNLEQLVPAGATIAGLLQACPRLVVLASSRAPLRVRGEHELPVHPLTLPATGEQATPEELETSSAATLFVTRAQSVRPAFAVTPANAEAVAELCTRLDGIPLALELAAAKARALEPAELVRRLGDVLDRGAAADLPERQQTMTATLDWSYGLLGDAERAVLRRLGAFVDGFDLEAAEAVAAGDGAGRVDVVDTLGRLVEHSLVLYRPLADGTARYRLLEPVRQYALAKMDEDELRETSLRHARHFLARAQRDIPAYRGAGAVDALAATALDDGNHEAALERSVGYGEGELAAQLCFALWLYWWLRGTLITGRRHAEQALTLPQSDATRVDALLTRSAMTFAQGDLAASMPGWQEVRDIGLRIGDRHAQAHGTAGEALVAIAQGDLDHAESLLTRATVLSREGLDDELWLWSLVNIWLGTVRLLRGHAEEAGTLARRGIDAARSRGDRLVTYIGLFTASQAAAVLGDGAAAREHLEEGIRLSTQTRDLANLAYFVEALAVLEGTDVGAPGHARRVAVLLGTAEALRDRVGARVYGYYQPDESLRERVEHQVRSLLGPEAFADAVAEGRGLDADESAALALTRGQRLRLAGS